MSPKWKKGVEVAAKQHNYPLGQTVVPRTPDGCTQDGCTQRPPPSWRGTRCRADVTRGSSLSSHPNEEETTHALASFHASMSDVLNVSDAFPDSPPPWHPARQPMDDHRQPAGQPCTGTTGPRQDAAGLGQGGLNNPLEGGIPQPPQDCPPTYASAVNDWPSVGQTSRGSLPCHPKWTHEHMAETLQVLATLCGSPSSHPLNASADSPLSALSSS